MHMERIASAIKYQDVGIKEQEKDIDDQEAIENLYLCIERNMQEYEFYDQAEWIPFKDTENWYDDDTLQERINHRLAIDPENVQKIEINGDVFTLDRVD